MQKFFKKLVTFFFVLCFSTQSLLAMRQKGETFKDKPVQVQRVPRTVWIGLFLYAAGIVIYKIMDAPSQKPWLDPLSGASVALKDREGHCYILTRSLPGTMVPVDVPVQGMQALMGNFLRRNMKEIRLSDCPDANYQVVAAHKVFRSLMVATSNLALADKQLEDTIMSRIRDLGYESAPKENRALLHPFYRHARKFTNMTYIANQGKSAWGCIFIIPFPSLEQIQDATMEGDWHSAGQKLVEDLVQSDVAHFENHPMEDCIADSHIPVRGIWFHQDGSGVAVLFRLVGGNKNEFEAKVFQVLSRHGYDLEPEDTSCCYLEPE